MPKVSACEAVLFFDLHQPFPNIALHIRSPSVTASNAGHGAMSAVGADICLAAKQGDASWHPPPHPAPQTGKRGARAAEAMTPAQHLQPIMSPVTVVRGGCSFHVLPLSPAMPPDFHSCRDLIIPSAEAFCDPLLRLDHRSQPVRR
jgi:hypothetical protein